MFFKKNNKKIKYAGWEVEVTTLRDKSKMLKISKLLVVLKSSSEVKLPT